MRGFWFKRGRRRVIRRSAAALAILSSIGLLSHLIGEASAGPKKHSNKGPHLQKVQQATQQLQALQQATATQSKLQQIQTMVAAQQKHVQNVQKLVAAHKQKIPQSSQFPASPPTAAQPPKLFSSGHHQATIQKALAQVKAAKHTPTAGAPTAHKVHALIAKVIKNQIAPKAHQGQHHQALVKAALQHAKQHKIFAAPSGKQQATTQLIYGHIFAKLKGHGHGFGVPHIAKHNAVFQQILAKLSAAKSKRQAPPPAPAPTPAATASTSTQKKSSVVQAILPTVTQSATGTTVVAAVTAAVKGNGGGEGSDPNPTGNLLGSTISKLGGPKQPSDSPGSGGGSGRATDKSGRDDDDDAKEGGIVNALRSGGKVGRGAVAGGLNPLAGLPAVGTYNPKQVLAVNLSPTGLEKVLALNYKFKGAYALPLLGATITTLETPAQEFSRGQCWQTRGGGTGQRVHFEPSLCPISVGCLGQRHSAWYSSKTRERLRREPVLWGKPHQLAASDRELRTRREDRHHRYRRRQYASRSSRLG